MEFCSSMIRPGVKIEFGFGIWLLEFEFDYSNAEINIFIN